MSADLRWSRLNEIWQAALQQQPARRDEFLRAACAEDEALRAEILSLLAHDQDSGDFLIPPESNPTPAAFQHYEILEKIGTGGMGTVFRARDTRLNRIVALKRINQRRFSDNRFIREARAASALNHPNIVTIHDIVETAGAEAIVMEFVSGTPLDQLIPPQGLPLEKALTYAMQIAQGLAAAHSAGIVHRDIKPGNILINDAGTVKIVDFGLAKNVATVDAANPASSIAGQIVGTVAYMSPEQAQGKAVDHRSDIFSFGSVLHEMISGRRAFPRDTSAATLAAVIESAPSPLGQCPRALADIVSRCLHKDPALRWQTMADILGALRALQQQPSPQPRRYLQWTALTAIPLLIVGAGLLWRRPAPVAPKPKLVQLTSLSGSEFHPAYSPDGRQVAFTWFGEDGKNADIYVKLVGESTALRLTTDAAPDGRPAWSPDGKHIAFLRSEYTANPAIYLVSPLGGPERKLIDFSATGQLSWSPDAKWIAVSRGTGTTEPSGIYLLPIDGGEPRRLTTRPAPGLDTTPAFSANGKQLAYGGCAVRFSCDVLVQDLNADYTPRNAPRQLARQSISIQGITWAGDSIVYSGGEAWGLLLSLWEVKAGGTNLPERVELAGLNAMSPTYSPATNRLAFSKGVWNADIWRLRSNGETTPLITSSLDDSGPQYSPDGSKIAFSSARTGDTYYIWVSNADGSDPVQITNRFRRAEGSPRWSPDGKWIAFDALREDGNQAIYVIPATGGRPRRLTGDGYQCGLPSFSRDGNWVYFFSDRSGNSEIWRVPFAGGEPRQVTAGGGLTAFESVDGKTLFYSKPGVRALFAKPVEGGPETKLLDNFGIAVRDFAVFSDGIYYGGILNQNDRQVLFYSFATGKSRAIGRVDGTAFYGMAVSPDRKTILYTKSPTYGWDLMQMDGFR